MIQPKAMQCPQCRAAIAWDGPRATHPPFCCSHCKSLLAVSDTYWRAIVIPCLLGGFALAWAANLWTLTASILGSCLGSVGWVWATFPLAFPMGWVLVRTVPYFVSVPLQLYRRSSVTTLDLNRERDMELEERDVLP